MLLSDLPLKLCKTKLSATSLHVTSFEAKMYNDIEHALLHAQRLGALHTKGKFIFNKFMILKKTQRSVN